MKLNLIAGLSLALLAVVTEAGAQTTPPQTAPANNNAPAVAPNRANRGGRRNFRPPPVDPNAQPTNSDYHET